MLVFFHQDELALALDNVTYNIAKHLATILALLVGNTPHHIKNSQDFTTKIREIKLDPDETMVSYDVTSLFTCIPTTEAVATVRKRLLQDNTLSNRTYQPSTNIYYTSHLPANFL